MTATLEHPNVFEPAMRMSIVPNVTFVSLRQKTETSAWPEIRNNVLERLDARGIPIEMFQFVERRIRFVSAMEHSQDIRALAADFDLAWRAVPNCVKLHITGPGLRSTARLFYRAAEALREAGITLLHFSDASTGISLLVQEQDRERTETLLLRVFSIAEPASESPFIALDPDFAHVQVNGVAKRLGVRQSKLLAFLLDNAGHIVRAEDIAEYLFGSSEKDALTTLRVHVHNLRKKIERDPEEPHYLMTIPNRGYLFIAS